MDILKKHWYNFLIVFIVLFGILLRLKLFLINPSMWHDECALAWNIKFKSYSELFGPLRFLQVAPPFFMISTKLLIKFFGFSDMTFRLIPFLTGCLALIGFYFLSLNALSKKSSVLIVLFLFAINQRLINYSCEFKPYGVDVFFTIACLLFFVRLNIEKISPQKAFFYGILLAVVPWFSFVSAFVIAGGFLTLLLKKVKGTSKNTLFDSLQNIGLFGVFRGALKTDLIKKACLILPMVISGLIYLKICFLANYTGNSMLDDWQNFFVTTNPLHFLYLLSESVRYLFFPIQYVLFALGLLVSGLVILYKEKSSFFNLALSSFVMFLIASFLHIYPFSNRVILFLIPIYLLFVTKPLDLISFDKKIKSLIIILVLIFTFFPQFIWVNHFIQTSEHISKGEYPRETMELLFKKLNKNDIIFISNLSNTEFAYYSSFYQVKNQVIQEPQESKRTEVLNSIPKRSYCWFYLPYGNPKPFLDWIDKNGKVIEKINYGKTDNYLIYVYIK